MGSTTKATWYWDIIRELLAFLDKVGYTILGMVYKVFYSVATATIISGDVIRNFYGRMQLILGILMIYRQISMYIFSMKNFIKKKNLRINRIFLLFNICQTFFDDSTILSR